MSAPAEPLDLGRLPGLRWSEEGLASLSGPLLGLFRDLARPWAAWRRDFGAEEHACPVLLGAADMDRMRYFNSFPHLVTLAVNVEDREESLKAFAGSKAVGPDGDVAPFRAAPMRHALTPAPCYHLYPQFAGRELDAPVYLGTRNATFRREAYYQPLVRQWNYHSEEIVCLGSQEEVRAFLSGMSAKWDAFFRQLDLPAAWKTAVDPFFNADRNPSALLQKLDPVKRELTLGEGPALGSANFHRNFFCDTFRILRHGKPAFSGCVGWGVERMMYAIIRRHGYEPGGWPDLKALYPD